MKFYHQLLTVAVVIGCFIACTQQAEAHTGFKKYISSKYPDKKVSCNACHVDKKPKSVRNNLGKLFEKTFESKTLTKDFKSKKGAEKKAFEKEVLMPEFEKAYKKIEAMTVNDLMAAGYFSGIDAKE